MSYNLRAQKMRIMRWRMLYTASGLERGCDERPKPRSSFFKLSEAMPCERKVVEKDIGKWVIWHSPSSSPALQSDLRRSQGRRFCDHLRRTAVDSQSLEFRWSLRDLVDYSEKSADVGSSAQLCAKGPRWGV